MTLKKISAIALLSALSASSAFAGSAVEWTCTKQLKSAIGSSNEDSGKITVVAIRDEKGLKTSYRYKTFYTSRLGAGASTVTGATPHPDSASDIYYGDDETSLSIASFMRYEPGYVKGTPVPGSISISDSSILRLMSIEAFQKDVTVDRITVSGLECK